MTFPASRSRQHVPGGSEKDRRASDSFQRLARITRKATVKCFADLFGWSGVILLAVSCQQTLTNSVRIENKKRSLIMNLWASSLMISEFPCALVCLLRITASQVFIASVRDLVLSHFLQQVKQTRSLPAKFQNSAYHVVRDSSVFPLSVVSQPTQTSSLSYFLQLLTACRTSHQS